MLYRQKIKKAFTLAEVLITLGIIGVVAAMTIPTLIKNYQKQETVSKLKKVYTVMSQAYLMSVVDNGNAGGWDWATTSVITFSETYFTPYLSIMKNCGTTISNCTQVSRYWLDGTPISGIFSYAVYLKDGTQCFFMRGNDELFQIAVDINGDKKPNIAGKDIFFMRFFNSSKPIYAGTNLNRLSFVDPNIDRNNAKNSSLFGCRKDSTAQAGIFCGRLIQLDGWQIKDDYPWD